MYAGRSVGDYTEKATKKRAGWGRDNTLSTVPAANAVARWQPRIVGTCSTTCAIRWAAPVAHNATHKSVTSLATLRRITREVLHDFAADNVKYLELRTTPRAFAGASLEDYVLAVLEELARRTDREAAAPPAGTGEHRAHQAKASAHTPGPLRRLGPPARSLGRRREEGLQEEGSHRAP